MKKVLFILIVLSLTAFIYSSCSKEAEEIKYTLNLEEISRVGEIHNQALDYLSENIDVNSASKEMYFNTIKEYLVKVAVTNEEKMAITKMNLNTCDCDKKYYSIEGWIKKNNPNKFEENYLLEYSKVINKVEDVNKFWIEVEKIEANIYNEVDSNIDKVRLLGFSSILKHSFKYWTKVKENKKHTFHQKMMIQQMDKSWPGEGIDFYALIDALAYYDCLGNGGFGNYDTAVSVCTNQATYASARAFDDGK